MQDLKSMINTAVTKFDNRILYEEKGITYKEFGQMINYLSAALFDIGAKNKRIAIISENRYEWEIAFFGVVCGIGTCIPIDKSYSEAEIENVINKAKVEIVFCSGKFEKTLNEIKMRNSFLKTIISFDGEFEKMLEKGKDKTNFGVEVNEEDECVYSFTSGTTSESKAVILTHKNICSDAESVLEVYDIDENDVFLSVLPLSHVLEGLFCMLLCINKGAKRVYCNSIDEIIDYVDKYKITFMGAVPAIYEYLYSRNDELIAKAKTIKFFMSGGAKLAEEVINNYKSIGIQVYQGYGLTEGAPAICLETRANSKLGSVGKVLPNIELKLENINKDGVGELFIKGENVTKGYFENKQAIEDALVNRWLNTGDLARIDSDGYVFICGRTKDVIVLSTGKKIFPEEIENIINKVEGIKESIVFKAENEDKIVAKVVYDTTKFEGKSEESIKEILLKAIGVVNSNLAQYQRITDIVVTNVEFEKTELGKIKRNTESYLIKKNEFSIGESSEEKVITILKNKLGVDEITMDMELVNNLGADSLDIVEVFLEIEKTFGIKIDRDTRKNVKSVGDLVKIVR